MRMRPLAWRALLGAVLGLLAIGLASFTLAATSSDAPPTYARRALVIGIDGYSARDLQVPGGRTGADAAEVARVLRDVAEYDTVVTVPRDADKLTFATALDTFSKSIHDGDLVVVFYSGHGVEFGGDNYFLLADTQLPLPDGEIARRTALQQSAVSQRGLLQDLRGRRPGNIVLIVNACRTDVGPAAILGTELPDGAFDIPAPSAKVAADPGTMVIYSTSSGKPAMVCLDRDCSTDNSPMTVFTRRLVVALAQPNLAAKDLTDTVSAEVEKDVKAAVNELQLVSVDDQISNDFKKTLYLGPVRVADVGGDTTGGPGDKPNGGDGGVSADICAAARADWALIDASGVAEVYQAFIDQYPTCTSLVALAGAELKKLESTQPPVPVVDAGEQCDALASDAGDRRSVAPGVLYSKIDKPVALAACRDAVGQSPDEPRYRYQYSRVLTATGDIAGALEQLRIAAEARYPQAMYWYGKDLEEGTLLPRDKARALELYTAAAGLGSPAAMTGLGLVYSRGTLAAADLEEAARWYGKAVELDEPLAYNNLGALYRDGRGVKKSAAKAQSLFERAIALGNISARFNLAWLLDRSPELAQDPDRTAELLLSAARADADLYAALIENFNALSLASRHALQRRLQASGYTGAIDGAFGPGTAKALAIAANRAP